MWRCWRYKFVRGSVGEAQKLWKSRSGEGYTNLMATFRASFPRLNSSFPELPVSTEPTANFLSRKESEYAISRERISRTCEDRGRDNPLLYFNDNRQAAARFLSDLRHGLAYCRHSKVKRLYYREMWHQGKVLELLPLLQYILFSEL